MPVSEREPKPMNSNLKTPADYRKVVISEMTEERWRVIVQREIAKAMKGDSGAARWLGQYVCQAEHEVIRLPVSALAREDDHG